MLPLEVAQKGWINDRLQTVFQRWGYQRIVTSTLEWMDTLMAGGAIAPSTVIQLQDLSEGRLGLRPELTASIARTAVTRMAGNTYPQRLCYRANVFRNPPPGHHGKQIEFYQAGVELLFRGGVLADAEILLLLADSLTQLGLRDWHLIVGEAGLTRSLLSVFPEPLEQQVRHCIAKLDYVALEALAYPHQDLRDRALLLFDLRGKPADVLSKVLSLDLEEPARQAVDNLKSLMELLDKSCQNPLPLILDLSFLQTFDYYTGIVFQAISRTQNQLRILGQGGRYDQLLGVYHPQKQSAPGIGFSLNIEDLHACVLALSSSELPKTSPLVDWLVVPQTPQAEAAAFSYAQTLRTSECLVRVEMDLGERSPEQIRDYARSCSIKNIAWLQADGTPILEPL